VIDCEPTVVSVGVQVAAPLDTVPVHKVPCVEDVNVTVPVGFVLFTTDEGVTVAVNASVAPLVTV
jgi:hypothetical protein